MRNHWSVSESGSAYTGAQGARPATVAHVVRVAMLGLLVAGIPRAGHAQNQAPVVDAGQDQAIGRDGSASLQGKVTDDGLPMGSTVAVSWSAPEPDAVYSEDFEAGTGGFGPEALPPPPGRRRPRPLVSWGIVESGAISPTHVWTDSPGGNYANMQDVRLTSPAINLSAFAGQHIRLRFWQQYDLEDHFDFGYVEMSNDGGSTWWVLGSVTGTAAWHEASFHVDPSFAVSALLVRFRLVSNDSITRDGWSVDDFAIELIDPISVWSEDVEGDTSGWMSRPVTGTRWAVTTSEAHSALSAWTDSPGGDYPNRQNTRLVSPPLDLSAYAGQRLMLSYWHRYDLERSFDFGHVEISTDGVSWARLATYTGVAPWHKSLLLLDPVYARAGVRLRFRLTSDEIGTRDGWYVDDIAVGTVSIAAPGRVSFTDAGSPKTTATFSAPGTYVLRLTATDSELTASDTVTITVTPAVP
jgi:hypothetical protein